MRSAGIAYYYSSLITHVITGCGHDNIEIVVDLDYLSHVYVTTLFIRHFDIIIKRHMYSEEKGCVNCMGLVEFVHGPPSRILTLQILN